MPEHPIIFSGPMVRAILEGRKTQTRRVIKPQPGGDTVSWGCIGGQGFGFIFGECMKIRRCPYGIPGDRLWVREGFGIEAGRYVKPSRNTPVGGRFEDEVFYKADDPNLPGMKWRPSIHMPRKYARLILEVTEVRVERVQDITPADAQAEGVDHALAACAGSNARDVFGPIWDSINLKRGYGWEANPRVWVVTFERTEVQV